MQASLFQAQENLVQQKEIISLTGGGLIYFPSWLPLNLADCYFSRLQSELAWQQSLIQIAGKDIKIPRLNAWYGDKGARYQYSNKMFEPLPWTRSLSALKTRVCRQGLGDNQFIACNSALANYYRDGNDSVAWHADDEKELGAAPMITSLSLGERRRFLLKRRDSKQKFEIELDHGSLLVMLPPMQSYWLHCLPKTKQKVSPRINVTFRQVHVS